MDVRKYVSYIRSKGLLTREEEKALLDKIKAGDNNARDEFLSHNLGLVLYIVNKYNLDEDKFEDILQEGNIGLIHALKKFDDSRNCKFGTYAVWWIRSYVNRSLKNRETELRLPEYMIDILRKIRKIKTQYYKDFGCQPSTVEITSLFNNSNIKKYSEDYIQNLLDNNAVRMLSLESKVECGEGISFMNCLVDTSSCLQDSMLEYKKIKVQIENLLEYLKPRERDVIKMRYGLKDGIPRTLKEVGLHLDISRQRVKQLEKNGIERLKRRILSKQFHDLADYIYEK